MYTYMYFGMCLHVLGLLYALNFIFCLSHTTAQPYPQQQVRETNLQTMSTYILCPLTLFIEHYYVSHFSVVQCDCGDHAANGYYLYCA